jgi:hypothetical protein
MKETRREIHPTCTCGGNLDLIDKSPLMQIVFGYALFECTKCKKKYKASTITGEFEEF